MENEKHPINNVIWLHRDQLTVNNYNPNKVAQPELELIKISLEEDGWTAPIVITEDNEIVDGYHRWLVTSDPRIYQLTRGYVPVVTINPKDRASQQMATIRQAGNGIDLDGLARQRIGHEDGPCRRLRHAVTTVGEAVDGEPFGHAMAFQAGEAISGR